MSAEFDAWYERLRAVLEESPRQSRYVCSALELVEDGDGEIIVSCRVCCTGHAREMLEELTDRVIDEIHRIDRATMQ